LRGEYERNCDSMKSKSTDKVNAKTEVKPTKITASKAVPRSPVQKPKVESAPKAKEAPKSSVGPKKGPASRTIGVSNKNFSNKSRGAVSSPTQN